MAYVLEAAPRLFALKAAPQSRWVAAVVRSASHRPPMPPTAAWSGLGLGLGLGLVLGLGLGLGLG